MVERLPYIFQRGFPSMANGRGIDKKHYSQTIIRTKKQRWKNYIKNGVDGIRRRGKEIWNSSISPAWWKHANRIIKVKIVHWSNIQEAVPIDNIGYIALFYINLWILLGNSLKDQWHPSGFCAWYNDQ